MRQVYWGEKGSGYVALDATRLSLDYGDCIVRNDSGGVERLTFTGDNGVDASGITGTWKPFMAMPTHSEPRNTRIPIGYATRCSYCGVRSIPHTDAGRALMCPACGAPMP